MKFFSLETCIKLQDMGCKSENKQFWLHIRQKDGSSFWVPPKEYEERRHHASFGIIINEIHAYSQNDFTGCHKQARENARIVWPYKICWRCGAKFDPLEQHILPSKCPGSGFSLFCAPKTFEHHRREMIDAFDAEKYLEGTIK